MRCRVKTVRKQENTFAWVDKEKRVEVPPKVGDLKVLSHKELVQLGVLVIHARSLVDGLVFLNGRVRDIPVSALDERKPTSPDFVKRSSIKSYHPIQSNLETNSSRISIRTTLVVDRPVDE
ncbi:hypothetical protein KSP40_PGU018974 [Platanthera guangdongensis]|uniref:Uncharacterized protein n=1 Tax=Platanthera guangdongensis TaxID=2320717 RepID=A0ABR2M091_9ASPA